LKSENDNLLAEIQMLKLFKSIIDGKDYNGKWNIYKFKKKKHFVQI